MAKKKDKIDVTSEDDDKKSNKLLTSLFAVFIVIIWVAIFALLIKLDVGGFGSSVLRPVLKNVPVINMILPEASDDEVGQESGSPYKTLSSALQRIKELENELAIYKENGSTSSKTISELTAEVQRLKIYESNQKNFEALKEQFDKNVVYADKAPELEAYKKWYEEMYPENSAEIYRQVTEQLAQQQVIQDLANYYSSMKATNAAAIFEEMTGDMEKVASILSCMKPANAGEILAAMDSVYAAKITLLMYPTGE